MEMIPYNEVLYQIDRVDAEGKPVPFSFTCSTGTGRFLEVKRAVKNILKTIAERKESPSSSQPLKGSPAPERATGNRQPATSKEMFIRVLDMDANEIKTVYPRTFIFFNGFKVSPEL